MNFELKHMKNLQRQKDTILRLDASKQKLEPLGTRLGRKTRENLKSCMCDLQSMLLFAVWLASLAFWLTCLFLKPKSGATKVEST